MLVPPPFFGFCVLLLAVSIVRTIALLATVSHDVPSNLSEIRCLSEILQINLNADGGNITTVSFKTTKI